MILLDWHAADRGFYSQSGFFRQDLGEQARMPRIKMLHQQKGNLG